MSNKDLKNYPKKPKPLNQHEKLKKELKSLYASWDETWDEDLPKKWKIAQDLLILPSNCFQGEHWTSLKSSELLWKTVAGSFKLRRIAQENKVKPDDFRSPNLILLFGDDPVVIVNNNGIKYCYDITKCMFSWGNITEKLRIANFDCSKEVVVDLFAGIGYFAVVYLKHARAKHLIACEWNPASVAALKKNMILNEISEERYQIFLGDNRETCPTSCADRVNLGLIPTSEESWPTACNALKKETGGYLHIHGNVDIHKKDQKLEAGSDLSIGKKTEWIEWANYTENKIKDLLNKRTLNEGITWDTKVDHIEYVKSYGPRVDHLVLDVLCKPIVKEIV